MPTKVKKYCSERSSNPMGGFCQYNAGFRVKIGSKPYKLMCGRHKNAAVKKNPKAIVKTF